MRHGDEIAAPHRTCELCSSLLDEEYAFQTCGGTNNTYLPDAAQHLDVVRDFNPRCSRKLQIRQCRKCGTFYLYRSDYEYLVVSEDEEFLTRLTEEQAAEYLNRPAEA